MTLAYRALLTPTAAQDGAGNAKPNAVFEVRDAGNAPVAVYAAAQGGTALAANQIKADSLGNVGGFYVDTPGLYTLDFVGGGRALTVAVRDERDTPTAADLVAAVAGKANQSALDAVSAALAGKTAPTDVDAKITAERAVSNSTFVPRWKPNTAYTAGQSVISPAGDIVTAKAAFTSAATYSAANWNLSPTFAPLSRRGQQAVETRNDAALLTFHAALGDVANNPVNIGFIGHSMVEGYSSTKTMDRFADSSIVALRRRLGVTGGLGYRKANKSFAATDYPIVNTGTILGVGDLGFGSSGGLHLGTGYVTAQTITVPAGTTSVDIVWGRESGAGTFSWALDGGAANNVSTAGALQRWQTTRITVAPGSAHTIVLAPVSGFSRVGGAVFYAGDETNGIRGFEGGLPSATTATMLPSYTGANAAWLDAITVVQPQLIVVTSMCNDYMSIDQNPGANRVQPATTKANIKTMVDTIAARCTVRPSVVLCVENQRNNIDAGLTPSKWADYVQAAYDLADAENYAVFDWGNRIGNVPGTASAAAGMIHTDGIHPSTKGHRFWGEGLGAFLAPR